MQTKITEMIPDMLKMPEWARDSMKAGTFFNVSLRKVKHLENRLLRLEYRLKHRTQFIKQNDNHSCFACCVAMITKTTLADITKFVGHDGTVIDPKSNHPDKMRGFSNAEMNRYLSYHNFTLGCAGADMKDAPGSEMFEKYSHIEFEFSMKSPALIIVKSLRFKKVNHCIYWDGKKLWDPNVGEVEFPKYTIKEWWPISEFAGV